MDVVSLSSEYADDDVEKLAFRFLMSHVDMYTGALNGHAACMVALDHFQKSPTLSHLKAPYISFQTGFHKLCN